MFITGATGFMGKVLVEKLLMCTPVERIYLLIRPKKGVPTDVRLQELMESSVFDKLKAVKPEQLERVQAVQGDITEDGLGLSTNDEDLLANNVSVVFHSAATVKFDEELTKAVAMNVESVMSLMQLCRKMSKLEALIHVSTAYCNCDMKKIGEVTYPPPGNPQGIIQVCKYLDADVVNSPEVTEKLIGNRPNTYTFTKALAENLLKTEGSDLPIAIVRPSIVTAAWKEPSPGWVDNINGATGLLSGCLKGILRTIHCHREMAGDLVPVDIPINLMICIAWRTATQTKRKLQIYNCTSSGRNPIRWGEFEAYGREAMFKYPPKEMFWYPNGSLRSNIYAHRICQVVFHSVPAYLFDLLARMTHQKPYMVKLTKRMHKATKTLEYFTLNEWRWTDEHTVGLCNQITDQDRQLFNFDISQVNWHAYLEDYVKGVRQFVLKEADSTLPESRNRLNRLFWLDKAVQMILFLLFWRFVLTSSDAGSRLWSLLTNLFLRFFRFLPIEEL